VGGVVEKGVAEAALVDKDGAESSFLSFDSAGQASGASAYDEKVEGGLRDGMGL
jgi:hypothetical protein